MNGVFVAKFIVTEREPGRAYFHIEENDSIRAEFSAIERPYIHFSATEEGMSIGPADIWEVLDVGQTSFIIYRTTSGNLSQENFEVFDDD